MAYHGGGKTGHGGEMVMGGGQNDLPRGGDMVMEWGEMAEHVHGGGEK